MQNRVSVRLALIAALTAGALAGCGSDSDSAADGAPMFRAIDGAGNNPLDAEMGQAERALARQAPAAFGDGLAAPAGSDRPNPRVISNVVCAQSESRPNASGASAFLWQWGQFLDHDLSLSREQQAAEALPIAVPAGDPDFDPSATGAEAIAFHRSEYDPATGETVPRQQMNALTAFIDASNVYGSHRSRALALRAFDGSGRLRTSSGGFLPRNDQGLPNAPSADEEEMFLAGDVRANEQVALTAMHTLFVREHNRLAHTLSAAHPHWNGDRIYQQARAMVGAKMQHITYQAFLPLLLGPDALSPYRGYNPLTDVRLMNAFTSAAFRLGHSLLNSQLLRLDADGRPIEAGHLPLRDAYFVPQRLVDEGGLAPLLRGLAAQPAEAVDPLVVDAVRNFLFGSPQAGPMDLAALNIQRGRDHGIPSYNALRRSLGLVAKEDIDAISTDPEIRQRLHAAYDNVEHVDAWIGGLAEDPVPGAMVGELFFVILKRQFERLRDGDRFWYRNLEQTMFSADERAEIESSTLARLIRRNTAVGEELPDNVFVVPTAAR